MIDINFTVQKTKVNKFDSSIHDTKKSANELSTDNKCRQVNNCCENNQLKPSRKSRLLIHMRTTVLAYDARRRIIK